MPSDFKTLFQSIPGATEPGQQCDGWWMTAPALDVLAMAGHMQAAGARLSTITAAVLPGEETEVIYHYYLDHQTINFKVATRQNSLASISRLIPSADWAEREIQDLYRVEFTDHPHPTRLIRPTQLQPGFFREPGGAADKN